jgi:hypothetical protein
MVQELDRLRQCVVMKLGCEERKDSCEREVKFKAVPGGAHTFPFLAGPTPPNSHFQIRQVLLDIGDKLLLISLIKRVVPLLEHSYMPTCVLGHSFF